MPERLETPLQFAREVSARVNADWESGKYLESVTETTRALLRWWFHESHTGLRAQNFHPGQRQAILNVIWLHEVAKAASPVAAYQAVAPDLLLEKDLGLERMGKEKYAHPKACVKMATGTGKTWVLQALLIWQYLNAKRGEAGNFSKNFLVVAPGLIVYERLLDAFLGKKSGDGGLRDFEQSDIAKSKELFLPEEFRQEVFGFLQSSVVRKEEIGRKVTGDGLIAITNWHLLAGAEEGAEEKRPGADIDSAALLSAVLPARPGKSAGNDLNTLDAEFARGEEIEFLKGLPDIVVFNDEAHHIHETKKSGEVNEVEWQKSLTEIAKGKNEKFIQIDFSATPYNERAGKKDYFPHIVVDFDLKTAIKHGLVKLLTLDRRKEIASLELDFKAERDEDGKVIGLSEGQRVMVRAGLTKLRILEKHFTSLGKTGEKRPKMMVVCEDTGVVPFVTTFLRQEGCSEEDVLEIHSNKKGEVGVEEWNELKGKLFDLDKHEHPRVVVSVLMLREGFDVSNICVIVPLRSAKAPILLEQTIGRGLRLMWREPEYAELKNESRKRLLVEKKEPSNYLDILSIVEHPSFIEFYEELMKDGLIGVDERDLDEAAGTDIVGDLESVGLREGYEAYDIGFPVIARESEELFQTRNIDPSDMKPFSGFRLEQLKSMVPKNDEFISQEATKGTRFGDYAVHGGVMTAASYNEYVANLVNRISLVLSDPISTRRNASDVRFPRLQVQLPELARVTDHFIRNGLFEGTFDPFADNNWRVLLIDPVAKHVIQQVSQKLLRMQEVESSGSDEVIFRHLSETMTMPVRKSYSVETAKTVYVKTAYPSNKGNLEKNFIEFLDADATVAAFGKVSEYKHPFVIFRYVKEDGMVGYYHPDFLVRCENGKTYIVETKAEDQMSHPNVLRKQKAVLAWVEKINGLPAEKRENTTWDYVLLGEQTFYDWKQRGGNTRDLLEFARVRKERAEGRLI